MARTPVNADIDAREAAVFHGGERIAAHPVEQVNDDVTQLALRMASVNKAIESRDQETVTALLTRKIADGDEEGIKAALAQLPEMMRTMLLHPQLFSRVTEMGIQLLQDGCLPPRERELAILRIGWLNQAPYEWGEHVLVAKKVGLTSEEIERVTVGSQAPGWTAHEAAVLAAAEELYADAAISDATWDRLAERYDERQLIELPILVGQYQLVAYYQNALRLRPHAGNEGLKAR